MQIGLELWIHRTVLDACVLGAWVLSKVFLFSSACHCMSFCSTVHVDGFPFPAVATEISAFLTVTGELIAKHSVSFHVQKDLAILVSDESEAHQNHTSIGYTMLRYHL